MRDSWWYNTWLSCKTSEHRNTCKNVCMFKKGQIHNEKYLLRTLEYKDTATVLGSPWAKNPWILGECSGEGWLQVCSILTLLSGLLHLVITGDRIVIRWTWEVLCILLYRVACKWYRTDSALCFPVSHWQMTLSYKVDNIIQTSANLRYQAQDLLFADSAVSRARSTEPHLAQRPP